MKTDRLLIFIMVLLLYAGFAQASDRNDIIANAEFYASYPLNILGSNILDTGKFDSEKTELLKVSDGIDDRAQQHWDNDAKKYVFAQGNRSWWPFFVGDSFRGVAYALDYQDTPLSFAIKAADGYVVGKRFGDPALSANTVHADYAGVDCSAFVSNISGVTNGRWYTYTIPDYCIIIDPKELKPGDPLVRSDFRKGEWHPHAVVFSGGDPNSAVDIYHAATWAYSIIDNTTGVSKHVRRVIKETGVESHVSGTSLTLRDKSVTGTGDEELIKHVPYTAFPLINNDLSPKIKMVSRTNPMVIPLSFTVRSKLRITTAEISINGVTVSPLLRRLNEETVYVTFQPDNPLRNGEYTINATVGNELEMTVSETFDFEVIEGDDSDDDGMPDEWETDHGFDPRNAGDATFQSDDDTLCNRDEYIYDTDPRDSDSDDDTEMDSEEIRKGKKPSGNPKIHDTPDYVEKGRPKRKDWSYEVRDTVKKFAKKVARIVTGRAGEPWADVKLCY